MKLNSKLKASGLPSLRALGWRPFLMWLFPLLFFAYQFIPRLWPGLMMRPIMEQFGVGAGPFGNLAALYYYGYAGMQIPVALLLERWGVRRVVSGSAVLCGVATLLFTYTSSWHLACWARFLVGAGSAAGFLGVSKVISLWFPRAYYGRMIGFSFTLGLLGAVYGGKPVSLLISRYGGTSVALGLGIGALGIGMGSWVFLRGRGPGEASLSATDRPTPAMGLKGLTGLLGSTQLWLLGLGNLLMVGPLEGFADVWGVSYLMKAYALERAEAAGLTSLIFFGMLFSGPALAYLSQRMGAYRVITLCGLGMVAVLGVLLSQIVLSSPGLALLFFTLGLLCCYQVVVFAAAEEWVPPAQLGITVAFLNCLNMLGGSLFHTVIGQLMDYFAPLSSLGASPAEGFYTYPLTAYTRALAFIPLCAALGSVLIAWAGVKIRRKTSASPKPRA